MSFDFVLYGAFKMGVEQVDYLDFYREFGHLTNEETIRKLAAASSEMAWSKGDILIRPGETNRMAVFMLKGVAKRYVCSDNGEEQTVGFYWKYAQPLVGAYSFTKPANVWVKFLTPAQTLVLPWDTLMECMHDDAEVAMAFAEHLLSHSSQQIETMKVLETYNAADRYRWFLRHYEDIADRIQENDIALFLGIRPQSLSRIKRALIDAGELN